MELKQVQRQETELTGRLPCSECREPVEFDMVPIFEYALQEKYGLTVKELEEELGV